MTYLAFIFATGLYYVLGSGGPLHRDEWFATLQRRVDATEPPFWLGFVLLIGVPCAVLGLVYGVIESVLGSATLLILGTLMLFFAFGRLDYPTLTQRFLARSRAGDDEGAALIIEQAGMDTEAEDRDAFARLAGRDFLYEGFQRWFPAVFYFLLLGPLWAVSYRLIQLAADDRRVPVGTLRHLIDWLPSRLLLFTFALAGNFEQTWRVIAARALDPEIATDELLLEGAEAAFGGVEDGAPANVVAYVTAAIARAMVIWLVVASLVAML